MSNDGNKIMNNGNENDNVNDDDSNVTIETMMPMIMKVMNLEASTSNGRCIRCALRMRCSSQGAETAR